MSDPLNEPVRARGIIASRTSVTVAVRPADVLAAMSPEQRRAMLSALLPDDAVERVARTLSRNRTMPGPSLRPDARAVLAALTDVVARDD